ncbi:Hypothetical protein A7982_05567 [Minicystis rosea]|nr:Hypothetical protein A7982_05567 [Minicystis rosea]
MTAKMVGATAIAVCLLVGCAPEQAPSEGSGKTEAAPSANAAAKIESTPITLTRAQMEAPAGWQGRTQGAWTVHSTADRRTHLAAASIGAGDTVAARVSEAIGAMGGAEPKTGDEQSLSIGPEQLPAKGASGSCRFGGDEGRMQYAVIDVGEGQRTLLVYAAAKDAPEDGQRTAFASIATLRRK